MQYTATTSIDVMGGIVETEMEVDVVVSAVVEVDVAVEVDVTVEVVEVLLVAVADGVNVVLWVVRRVVVLLTRAVDVDDEVKVAVVVMEVVEEELEVETTVEVEKAVPSLVETTVLEITVFRVLRVVEVEVHDGMMLKSNRL